MKRILVLYGTAPISLAASASVPRLLAQLLGWIAVEHSDWQINVVCPDRCDIKGAAFAPVTFTSPDRIWRRLARVGESAYVSQKAARIAASAFPAPDVILTAQPHAAIAARKRFRNAKLLYWVHSLPVMHNHLQVAAALVVADLVIVPSRAVADALRGIYEAENVRVIPNGVNLEQFQPPTDAQKEAARRTFNIPESVTAIAHAGGDGRAKGRWIVEAALVKMESPSPIILLSAGAGEARRKKLAANVGLIQVGKLEPEKIASLFHAADIGVLPSQSFENQPLTLIEMMASGLPVIASNIGGVGEIVEDEKSGLLINNPSSAHEWEEQFTRLLRDAPLREQLGAAARVRALCFSSNSEAIRSAWRSILD